MWSSEVVGEEHEGMGVVVDVIGGSGRGSGCSLGYGCGWSGEGMSMGSHGWSGQGASLGWSSGVGQLLGVQSPGWVVDRWGERRAGAGQSGVGR
jgi:hypothetical protein